MAMQLDLHGEPWEYEPRAFANEYGQYLPDFVLTDDPQIYVEMKPTLAAGEAARCRMEIIWDSEPDAILQVITSDGWILTAIPATRIWQRDPFQFAEMDW